MAFILTIFYIAISIISPEQFGPQWQNYHVLMYLAGVIFLLSLPNIFSGAHLRSAVQTYLLIALLLAIGVSALANGWVGGAVAGWQSFLPSAAVFFFIVANVTTFRRLTILTLSVVASFLVLVIEALCGYYWGFRGGSFVLQQGIYSQDQMLGQIARLRGPGFLSDPNDFAQGLLIALPLVFLAWQKRGGLAHYLAVLLPASLLLWALYLTHSRGGLVALAIVTLVAVRKRIGTKASVILAGALVLGMLAADFTGGRGISAVEGADRMDAWVSGLEMFKRAPIFGLGFGSFTDFNEITAHNSFVLCLAELGLVGSTIWVGLLVTTMLGLNRAIKAHDRRETDSHEDGIKVVEQAASSVAAPLFRESLVVTSIQADTAAPIESQPTPGNFPTPPAQWPVAMRLALIAFMVTSWFLSRSFQTPMYLILGLATATLTLSSRPAQPAVQNRWIFSTLAAEVMTIVVIYGIGQFRH